MMQAETTTVTTAADVLFYEPKDGHGLPYDPFKAIIAPRPIGWISTVDAVGRNNIAPYSFFNAIASNPHLVMFSSEGLKDSPANAKATGEFVCNLATLPLAEVMNRTARDVGPEVDEFALAGIETAPCRIVRPLRVAASPAALECKVVQVMELQDLEGRPIDRHIVIGQVVGVHVDRRYLKDGRFDTAAAQPVGRAGYADYAAVTKIFTMPWPNPR